jgi:hypothetical protein
MALIASLAPPRWVRVTGGGARVRIYSGPLIHAAPVQWVQFAQVASGVPSAPLTFTVTMYSAAAPWYFVSTSPGTAWRNFAIMPGGLSPVDIAKAPWDAGFPIWAVGSPYAEFYVSTSITCMANLFVP